ncbi:uncharacterized protein PV07_07082 [Cladophialophora immunda]|uniref:Major facilitator superfamily (MFS) profile domain-containing protein n=1 Tax=Cladophialophora immunda TaxID=569365 RepID=A0A0D2CUK8_9EURO|nr:uncharacterized protein PV07_07082 [Cladophialophora immunda]KIW27334.1 hypothetical protein PV07_07082 [Cladophialophora immunda]OQV10328.1 hypothetical protein CLAIMM_14347 [Cladophialophora immunda]
MSRLNLYISAAVAASTGALFGYSVGFVGGLLVLPSFLRHFRLDVLPPNELARAQSLVVSSWIIGAFFGVPTGIPICSRFGRKACLIFSAALYVLGAALQVLDAGSALWLFEVGRFLNGYGVGAGTLVSPIYISEIATPSDRGILMSSFQVVIQGCAVVGFWGAYAANAAIADTSDLQWQVPVAVQLVPGILLLLGTLYIKETPHYLAAKDDLELVGGTLSWFRGLSPSDAAVKREAREISQSVLSGIRRQAIHKTHFLREALSNPIRKRLTVGVGLFVAQNMSGMNALNYYVAIIFLTAGFKSVSASLFLTGIFGLAKLVSALLFMFLCVRIYGNRFWLLWGTGICAISMFVLGYCAATMPEPSDDDSIPSVVRATLCVLSVYVYAVAFGVSSGPIAWNVCSEIFPSYINAKCCAVTTCTQWLFQIIVAAVTPILLASIGPMTFVFYGACNVIAMAFYYLCVPETRGVALGKEMSQVFGQDDRKDGESDGAVEEVEDADDDDDDDDETPLLATERKRRRSSIAIMV